MARSSPPELPLVGHVATYGLEAFQFFAPVSLGILGALFGVVAVSGAALVMHSSGVVNSTVDSVPAATAQSIAEPDVPSDQSAPASPINETLATDIPEVGNRDLEADARVESREDQATVAERRIFAALSEQAVANFAECPLVDAVEFLSRQHAIPILLDVVAIEEAGLLVDEPINLVLAGVTLRSVLNIMLSGLELTFLIEDEVIKITTVEVASESAATRSNQIAENATTIASERRIKDALSDEASVNFADTPLVDAIEFIQRRHAIPILLDIVAIEEAGLLVDEPINLVLAGVTLRSVLNIMLSDLELTFLIEDEVMKITTVEVASERLSSRANVTEDRKLVEQSDDAPAEGGGVTVNPERPLDDVRAKAGVLPITRITPEQKTVNLCSIVGVAARSVKLELVGNEFADGKQLTLTKDDANNDASSLWKVIQKPASALERPVELGQFELSDERLSFLAADHSESSLLEFCLLRVSTADPPDTEICRLWKPLQLNDLPVSFEDARTVYNLIPDNLPQLPANDLRLTIETVGCGDCEFPAGTEVAVGSPVTVEVMNRGGKLFSTRFSLTTQDNRPLFVVSHFADVPQVTLRDDTPSIALSEQPLSTATLVALRRNGLKQQRDINNLVESKSRLLSRATTFSAKRALKEEISTLIDTSSSLDELATRVAALEEALEKIASSGLTGLRLVRRVNDEDEIVVLETRLFSEQQ